MHHILDPGAIQETNHSLELNRDIAGYCRSRGISVRFGIHRRADRAYDGVGCPVERVFGDGLFGFAPWIDEIAQTGRARQAARFTLEIDRFLGDQLADGDTVIVHTCTPIFLLGLAAYLRSLEDHHVRVAIQIPFQPETGVPDRLHGVLFDVLKRAGDLLRQARGHTVDLYAPSPPLAARYQTIFDLPVSDIPAPLQFPASAGQPCPPHPGVRLGYFGGVRGEKGLSLAARVARPAAVRHGHLRFLFQVPDLDPALAARNFRSTRTCEVVAKTVPTATYYRLISECDAVLLPYYPGTYAYRRSQLLWQCMGLGRPVITFEGTSLAYELRERNPDAAVIVPRYSTNGLAAGIDHFIENRQALTAAALEGSGRWRQEGRLDRYCDLILTGNSGAMEQPTPRGRPGSVHSTS